MASVSGRLTPRLLAHHLARERALLASPRVTPNPALLRALEGAGIDVGHAVTVTGRGAVQVDGGATIELPDAAASAVWITA